MLLVILHKICAPLIPQYSSSSFGSMFMSKTSPVILVYNSKISSVADSK
jgi:hypothetical protein